MNSTLLLFRWRVALVGSVVALSGCSAHQIASVESRPALPPEAMVEVLNTLRNDITARYGFRDGAPRVNLGPCGRFARDFRERWNARFHEPVTIAFIMSNADTSNCHHVLVKLPDGRYFDGGNGGVTEMFLATLYPDSHIDEMRRFDFELLDKRSYGLGRAYPECPNYSDEFTRQVIETRLSELLTKGGR